jgi:hypothetical protein
MVTKTRIYQAVLFVGIFSIILLLIFKKDPKPIYPIAPVKVIEKRIDSKNDDIVALLNQVAIDRQVISTIYGQLKVLKVNLARAKYQKDTVQIIQMQDQVILKQDTTIYQYQQMDIKKDSIIWSQKYVINSQDTIIRVQKNDHRKVKRQRNVSILFNAILAGLLIIK